MLITPVHIPVFLFFFVLTALPYIVSMLMLIFPSSRFAGRRLRYGIIGAGGAVVAYYLAYLPIQFLSVAVAALVEWLFRGLAAQQAFGVVIILIFYVFWFIALLWGYISGFRVGWSFGGGHTLEESLQLDYLSRLFMFCVNFGLSRKNRYN